jgi:uncharacterized protein with HEPN domain
VIGPVRPERRALLELDALLAELVTLIGEGDATRFRDDNRYRWIVERLWIAIGNEAFAYLNHLGDSRRQPWRSLVELRNELAHQRLPDIDRDKVWRATMLRAARLREQVQSLLS